MHFVFLERSSLYGIYLGAALKANLATDLGRSENSMPMVTKTSFCLPRYFYFSELNVSPKDKIQTSHPLHVTCWSEVLKVSCGFPWSACHWLPAGKRLPDFYLEMKIRGLVVNTYLMN